jgi:hypothetical protein
MIRIVVDPGVRTKSSKETAFGVQDQADVNGLILVFVTSRLANDLYMTRGGKPSVERDNDKGMKRYILLTQAERNSWQRSL